MAVVQPPDQHVEEILLRELERVDKLLLEELERMDEMLLRIGAAIDRLPERIASVSREVGPVSGDRTSAAEPASSRATRPFDPYGQDEIQAPGDKRSVASQVAGKVQSWATAYAPGPESLRFATLALTVALLATAIAVVGLIASVFH
jgi:hypothetical protein